MEFQRALKDFDDWDKNLSSRGVKHFAQFSEDTTFLRLFKEFH